jgi:hypothetical protein
MMGGGVPTPEPAKPVVPVVPGVLRVEPEEEMMQRAVIKQRTILSEGEEETKEQAAAAIQKELAKPGRNWSEIMAGIPEKRGYAGREEIRPTLGIGTPRAGPISDYPTLFSTVSRGVQYGLGRYKTVEEIGRQAYEKGEPKPDPEALRPALARETMAWIERRQPSLRRRRGE